MSGRKGTKPKPTAKAEPTVKSEAEIEVEVEKRVKAEIEAKAKAEAEAKAEPETESPELTTAEERELRLLFRVPKLTLAQTSRKFELETKSEAAAVARRDVEKARKAALKPADRRKEEILARINTPGARIKYPQEIIFNWRLELRAIEMGKWEPGWRPPKKKSDIDKFLA